VEETDTIMAEVEEVTNEYLPLAQASSNVFFVLDELNLLNHFYQFSLKFSDIFDYVLLRNPSLQGVTDPHERLAILLDDLFLHVFKRTSRALLHTDHLTLAILLAQVKLRGTADELDDQEFGFLLEGGNGVVLSSSSATPLDLLDATQKQRLSAFERLVCFKDVRSHIVEHGEEWSHFLASNNPESAVPNIWPELTRKLSFSLPLSSV
jgi:dynein heavy chain 1